MSYYLHPPPQGPLARIIASIIAVFVLVGAVMLGMVAFLVIAGLALVAGLVLWLRIAWIKRRLQKEGIDLRDTTPRAQNPGHIIDAEYTVIDPSSEAPGKQDENQR